MALKFLLNTCTTTDASLEQRIRDFTAIMPVRSTTPVTWVTVNHSKEGGLINFDYDKGDIERLLAEPLAVGLRLIPALDKDGNLTVILTVFQNDANKNEIYDENGVLVSVCCPQPPPPYNIKSKLYHDLYDNVLPQLPLIA